MITDILNINGYSITIDVNPINPPMTSAKYAARITSIHDTNSSRNVPISSDNTFLSWGMTEEEAYDKAQNLAMGWAKNREDLITP